MQTQRIYNIEIAIILSFILCAAGKCAQISQTALLHNKPELVLQYSNSDTLLDASFAAHAPLLALNDDRDRIVIFNTSTCTLERSIDTGTGGRSRNYYSRVIALSNDGTILAFLAGEGEVQLWNTRSGNFVKKLPEPVGMPINIKWSVDGKKIAAGGLKSVRIWDVISGKVLRTFPASGDVELSSDGRVVGIASENDAALYDAATGRKIRSFHDKAGVSWPIVISPDGRYVATGGEDPSWSLDGVSAEYLTESVYRHDLKVKIWDKRTGKLIKMLPGYNNLSGGTLFLQFTPDSRKLFNGGEGNLSLWDIHRGKSLRNFDTDNLLAASQDGRMVAVVQKSLAVYSVKTGRSLIKLHSPALAVRSLAFSPDGKLLASGDQSQFSTGLRLWDIKNGKLSYALQGPAPDLHDVGFLPNQRVYSNSVNGIYFWAVNGGKLLTKWS